MKILMKESRTARCSDSFSQRLLRSAARSIRSVHGLTPEEAERLADDDTSRAGDRVTMKDKWVMSLEPILADSLIKNGPAVGFKALAIAHESAVGTAPLLRTVRAIQYHRCRFRIALT